MKRPDALRRIELALVAEEVSSGVRHDLRNQITIIRGALFFLRRKVHGTPVWTSDPRVADFFKAIEEQLDRATANVDPERIVQQLFVRRASVTELRTCVGLAIEHARVEPRVRISADVTDCSVDVDPLEVALAARCLIENAAEALPEGGIVEVRGGPGDASHTATIEVRGAGDFTGVTSIQAIQPFVTTKEGHLGLGLSMASRICRKYGGKLVVHAVESGSLICLVFPLCTARERRHEKTAPRG